MTEPITNADIEQAVRQRFDCAHVSVSTWKDETGREWIGASITWNRTPHAGTTWTLLGACRTREELLTKVREVHLVKGDDST